MICRRRPQDLYKMSIAARLTGASSGVFKDLGLNMTRPTAVTDTLFPLWLCLFFFNCSPKQKKLLLPALSQIIIGMQK